MVLNVVICDDCEKSRYIMRKYLDRLSIKGIVVVGQANNGGELINICRMLSPNIILLDIDMPNINGIDAAKKIAEFLPDVSFIFITAHQAYAFDAFQVYPADYILKPVSIERLENTLKRIIDRVRPKEVTKVINNITVISDHKKVVIEQRDIIFIERLGRKTLIHGIENTIETYETLTSIEKRLDSKVFIRIHRSYLINSNFKYKINKSLGRTYKIVFDGYEKSAFINRKNIKDI